MRQRIAKVVRRVERITGYAVPLNKFIIIKDGKESYFDNINKHITIINEQPEGVVYHEIGHSYFDTMRLGILSKTNTLAKQFRKRFGYRESYPKTFQPKTMIDITATNPEEDFCWCFAKIMSGESSKNVYPRIIRNKIRTVESIIRKAKIQYYS
jgi:hypothetical protein